MRALLSPRPADPLTAYEQRLAPLVAALRPTGTFGWLASDNGDAAYYQAQYTLAPRVLERGARRPLVIGVFANSPEGDLARHHLKRVRDLGNGVFLLEHE